MSLLICLSVILGCTLSGIGGLSANAVGNTVSDTEKLIDGIIAFKMKESGASSVQALINGNLTKNAGTGSEWYIFALSRYGKSYDFSSYAKALEGYIAKNDISNAVVRERYALAFAATGYNREYVEEVLDSSVGELGIMSFVFGLHLLNNGYKSSKHSVSSVTDKLLSLQFEDNGWALNGNTADVDVTAMVIQSLAPQYSSSSKVKACVDKALTLLSSRQLASGGFTSYGKENPESSAQVMCALSALKINPFKDSRFIKNGKTMLDGMLKFRLADGSFIHVEGSGYNHNATVQSLYCLVAVWRYMKGLSPIYTLGKTTPDSAPSEKTTSQKETENSADKENPTKPISPSASSADNGVQSSSENKTASAQSQTSTENGTEENQGTTAPEKDAENLPDENDGKNNNSSSDKNEQEEPSIKDNKNGKKKFSGYKLWALLAIWIIALVICAVLFFAKKRNKFNFIAVILVAALLSCAVIFTDFSSTADYYGDNSLSESQDSEKETLCVTISISCEQIVGKADKEYIPSDGMILKEESFVLPKGSTVYDCLVAAAKKHRIQIENDAQTGNSYENAYIKGINHIYEFDFGDMSGWTFLVNGEFSSVGCGQYVLSDSDKIEWIYSLTPASDVVNFTTSQ